MQQETNSPLKIERPPQTLREMTLERMRTAIISGYFKSGQRLVERPLCEQLGVSRSVVRETIRYLEAEGLVETLPNKGPIIATMHWALAEQIYDIRCLLESNAARACARHADADTKAKLKKALNNIKTAYSNVETGRILKATSAFYELIFVSSGHAVAWEIVQRLNGRISRLRAMTLGTRGRHESGFARMEKIYSGINNNDPEAAGLATETHIREAAQIAKTLLTKPDSSV